MYLRISVFVLVVTLIGMCENTQKRRPKKNKSILLYVNFKIIINESEYLTSFVHNSMCDTGNKL